MIWTSWRQHRGEAAVGALIFATLATAMLVVGSIARDRARALGLPACPNPTGDCGGALGRLHDDFHSIPPFVAALIVVPLVAGMFWGASLVSREYEAGTHRLAWTQSVSPMRWIATKITLIFTAVGAGALVLGLLATRALDPLTPAFGGRYNSTWYDIQGVVPAACMLFALALGVATSALLRRTIPAMAVTLVAYAAARIPVHWVRWHFAPLAAHTQAIPIGVLLQDPTGAPGDLAGSALPPGASLQTLTMTDPSGHPILGNQGNFDLVRRYCPNLQIDATRTHARNPGTCTAKIHDLSIHTRITYQPASHFWIVQTVEALIFLGLAALLVAITVLCVTRRRPI